jgi:hypothetical protein
MLREGAHYDTISYAEVVAMNGATLGYCDDGGGIQVWQ